MVVEGLGPHRNFAASVALFAVGSNLRMCDKLCQTMSGLMIWTVVE